MKYQSIRNMIYCTEIIYKGLKMDQTHPSDVFGVAPMMYEAKPPAAALAAIG